jgi:hypothetical protein
MDYLGHNPMKLSLKELYGGAVYIIIYVPLPITEETIYI